MNDVLEAHRARLAGLDRMWTAPKPLRPREGDRVLRCAGGEGFVRVSEADLDGFSASSTAAREARLVARVDGPKALSGLLDLWARDPGVAVGADSVMTVTWPSRDTAMVRPLLEHGFAALGVMAVRTAGSPLPAPENPGVTIRRLAGGDVEAATALWMEVIRWDEQFGAMAVRGSSEANVRREIEQALLPGGVWCWVAEIGGEPVGFVAVQRPERALWVAPAVAVAPAAYVACGVVTQGRRGRGVGAALLRRVHDFIDAEAIPVTALHYAALNPLSGPFWSRCGYRPLSTVWTRGTVGSRGTIG